MVGVPTVQLLWLLVVIIRVPTVALWVLRSVLVMRLPAAVLSAVLLAVLVIQMPAIRVVAGLVWPAVMLPALGWPAAMLSALGLPVAMLPALAGILVIESWRNRQERKHLRSFRARTRLLLKPEGRQLDSRTLLPLWPRFQLLVLPVAYT